MTNRARSLDVVSRCGCGTHAGKKAVAVDRDIKARNLTRLRRIERQVLGLQRLVDEESPEALRQRGDDDQAEATCDELVDVMYRAAR